MDWQLVDRIFGTVVFVVSLICLIGGVGAWVRSMSGRGPW